MKWVQRTWEDLTRDELYAIMVLRESVFIVEQTCAYLDADGYDPISVHLWAVDDAVDDAVEDVGLLAYCRLVPAGTKFSSISIGRVITAPAARGTGLGRVLMARAIAACGGGPIQLGAQAHLEKFYASLGFIRQGDVYDEDGIPHIDMLRTP